MHCNATLFQLVYGSDYLQSSLFISMYEPAVGFISPVDFANEASHVELSYGKIVTSQCCQYLAIFICVGEFMHPV